MPTMTNGLAQHYRRAVAFGDDVSMVAALVHGAGSSTYPLTDSTADKNFVGYWTKSTATSGTSRGTYIRHYLAGTGNDGECLRAFNTVLDVAAANAKGAHISLSFGSTGRVTGEGIAVRATLQLPNAAMSAGSYSANEAELWADGSSTNAAGVTALSLFRASLGGNATGVGTIDHKASLISIVGNAIDTGHIMQVKGSAAVSHTLRITVNGTPYYLMVSDTQ